MPLLSASASSDCSLSAESPPDSAAEPPDPPPLISLQSELAAPPSLLIAILAIPPRSTSSLPPLSFPLLSSRPLLSSSLGLLWPLSLQICCFTDQAQSNRTDPDPKTLSLLPQPLLIVVQVSLPLQVVHSPPQLPLSKLPQLASVLHIMESSYVVSDDSLFACMRYIDVLCRHLLLYSSLQPWSSQLMGLVVHPPLPSRPPKSANGHSCTLSSEPSLVIELPQWCLDALTPASMNFVLVKLNAVESAPADWFTLNVCFAVYDYKYFAGVRMFIAECRVVLRHRLLRPFGYQPLSLRKSIVSKLPLWTVASPTSLHHLTRGEWCRLVAFPPIPPVPPDPPVFIISSDCSFVTWFSVSTVSTLSCLGDMSLMTARFTTTAILPSKQGSILLACWIGWLLTNLGSMTRIFLLRLKLLSSHLPLYEDARLGLSSPLPRYEDLVTLPLYEDLDTLPLYEGFVTLPLYEDLVPVYRELLDSSSLLTSFARFLAPLRTPFDINRWNSRSVIKGSFYRCLIAFVAILEMGNCALVAVPISGVRSSAYGFILLNNSIANGIRGRLCDFSLFKCFVVIISLCFQVYFVVFSAYFAIMLWNIYSFYGA